MNYWDKYGEEELTEEQERQIAERIRTEEKIRIYTRFIEEIKNILYGKKLEGYEYDDIQAIKDELKELEEELGKVF